MSAMAANLTLFEDSLKEIQSWKKANDENMDQLFLLLMGMLIFLMQAGFAFLEAGAVRSKNTVNILIKNALDSFFGGVSYWIVGYAFAFGEGNSFIGYTYFAHSGLPDTSYAHWFFQFVFAATAATIVSGAVAERCEFIGYMIYCTIITGFIYPVVTHWAWTSDGWLAAGKTYMIDGEEISVTYADFAGSGVVHMVGGIAAFIAALALGPRIGRFDKETGLPIDIKGHSVPFASLGGFILVFGFFAFNGSSQGSISAEGDGAAVAIAVKNTVLAASGGGFTTLIMNKTKWFGDGKWSFLSTLNGCLAGMVAICAGCDQFYSYIAFITGILGGVAYMILTWFVLRLKVDDPLDATAVHFGGGVVGVLAVPLFSSEYGVFYNWNLRSAYCLGWQMAGMGAIIGWSAVLSSIMFFTLKRVGLLRVSFEYEMKGLDIPKHGEPAYPMEAYGHGWGEKNDSLIGLIKTSVKSSTAAVSKDSFIWDDILIPRRADVLGNKQTVVHKHIFTLPTSNKDVKIDIVEPQKKTGNPEVNAMQNKNGHVNSAFIPSNPDPTPAPHNSTQL